MKSSVLVSPAAATILVVGLSCIFLTRCGGVAEELPIEQAADEGGAVAEIELEPANNNSGTNGTVTFTDIADGVEVGLDVRGLPDSGATYLSHIHPGNCGEELAGHDDHGEAGEDHEHDDASAEDDRSDEIDYPLTPVGSDTEGSGSSTTLLKDVTVEELLSGEPKYINVHAAGSGDDVPPDLACSGLNQ